MGSQSNLAFEALADPTRRSILLFLASNGEAAAGAIAGEVDALSRTGVSSHLRVLRTAGLVNERKQGRYRYYSLDTGAVDEIVEFLAEIYRTSLKELKSQAEVQGAVGGDARRRGNHRLR